MNLSGVLSAMIEGLYRDRVSASLPAALSVAAPYSTPSARAEFLVRTSDNRFDARKAFGKASAANADFLRGESTFSPIAVQMNSHKAGYEVIPQSVITSTAMTTDIVQPVVDGQIDQIYGAYVAEFLEVAGNELPNAGSSWNISVPSASVVAQINSYIKTIKLASNYRPNTCWISEDAMFALQNLDEIQSGTAISGYTTTGSSVRRTGSIAPEQVVEFFKSRFKLDLFVEDRTILDATGASAYAAGDKMVIAHSAPGSANSALKTFHVGTYGGDNLVNFLVDQSAAPLAVGQVVRAEAVYAVKAVDPSAGLFVDLTLP